MHPDILESAPTEWLGSTYHAIDPATYLQPLGGKFKEPEIEQEDDELELGDWQTVPPAEPTQAAPGSPEKIAILSDRYSRGVDLWHDDDLCLRPVKSDE